MVTIETHVLINPFIKPTVARLIGIVIISWRHAGQLHGCVSQLILNIININLELIVERTPHQHHGHCPLDKYNSLHLHL